MSLKWEKVQGCCSRGWNWTCKVQLCKSGILFLLLWNWTGRREAGSMTKVLLTMSIKFCTLNMDMNMSLNWILISWYLTISKKDINSQFRVLYLAFEGMAVLSYLHFMIVPETWPVVPRIYREICHHTFHTTRRLLFHTWLICIHINSISISI